MTEKTNKPITKDTEMIELPQKDPKQPEKIEIEKIQNKYFLFICVLLQGWVSLHVCNLKMYIALDICGYK